MNNEDVTLMILKYVKAWEISPEKINDGFCGEFASMVIEALGGETDSLYESFTEGLIGHVWLTFQGKHYDAEAPHGVENSKDLPFFKRQEADKYLRIFHVRH